MSAVAVASAMLISTFAPLCEASAFLRPHAPAESQDATAERVIQGLLAELSHSDDLFATQQLEEELQPMYAALPKGQHGELEPPMVRYALHRYFAAKRGWHMKGLVVGSATNGSSGDMAEVFGHGLHSQGTSLRKLALFVSKFTHLVQKEAIGNLENIYAALRLSSTSPISKKDAEAAFKWYLVIYLLGDSTDGIEKKDLVSSEKDIIDMYPAWRSVKMWSKDLSQTLEFQQAPQRNPFLGNRNEVSFDHSASMVQELGHRFGSFQNAECRGLKGVLMDMEVAGTGRVPLSEFYRVGLKEDWQFNEDEDYLRSLGALDKTDPKRPSVLITNYIHSQTNCLSTSGFYSVCCTNECEGLLGHLERQIAAPSAPPGRIAEIVAHLESDTVEAPRNLSSVQLARLSAIADLHGGQVLLHGRLFAQWIHHAYPRECPFPHLSGSTSALSQEDWHKTTGGEAPLATKEVMKKRAAELDALPSELQEQVLPWTEVEELLVPTRVPTASASLLERLRSVLVLAAAAASVLPLARAAKSATSSAECKGDRYLV